MERVNDIINTPGGENSEFVNKLLKTTIPGVSGDSSTPIVSTSNVSILSDNSVRISFSLNCCQNTNAFFLGFIYN